jgi:hypothetical protein
MKAKLLFLCPLRSNKNCKVKKITVLVIVLATFLVACNKPNGFVINGKITNAKEKYLYLDELKVSSSIPLDSVKLSKDGSFKFKGKISYPNFYLYGSIKRISLHF